MNGMRPVLVEPFDPGANMFEARRRLLARHEQQVERLHWFLSLCPLDDEDMYLFRSLEERLYVLLAEEELRLAADEGAAKAREFVERVCRVATR